MVMAGLDSASIANANKTVAGVISGLTAVVATINVASAKTNATTFTAKAVFTASQVMGPDLTWALIGGTGKSQVTINGVSFSKSQLPGQSVNPWGALNATTYSGLALLIADWGLKEVIDLKYGMKYADPWLFGLGVALLAAGIFGGIFDPTGARGTGASISGFASRAPTPAVSASNLLGPLGTYAT